MNAVDLRKLDWDNKNATGSGNGSYYQAVDQSVSPTRYYKLSNFDSYECRPIGYESFFEVIAYRLGKMLGIDVLKYHLIEGQIRLHIKNSSEVRTFSTVLCYSEDFRKGGETKSSLQTWYNLNVGGKDIEQRLRSVSSYISDYLDKMFVFDCLICNRDRHTANIEVLQLRNGNYRFSPLFDHGQSFCAACGLDENAIRNFDYTKDIRYNDGIGKGYHFKNVAGIKKPVVVKPLSADFRKSIFYGMSGYLPQYVKDSVANTIEYRYRLLKNEKYIFEAHEQGVSGLL